MQHKQLRNLINNKGLNSADIVRWIENSRSIATEDKYEVINDYIVLYRGDALSPSLFPTEETELEPKPEPVPKSPTLRYPSLLQGLACTSAKEKNKRMHIDKLTNKEINMARVIMALTSAITGIQVPAQITFRYTKESGRDAEVLITLPYPIHNSNFTNPSPHPKVVVTVPLGCGAHCRKEILASEFIQHMHGGQEKDEIPGASHVIEVTNYYPNHYPTL